MEQKPQIKNFEGNGGAEECTARAERKCARTGLGKMESEAEVGGVREGEFERKANVRGRGVRPS